MGNLVCHNLTTGEDFIKIRYDKTKEDQDGEKIKDKHIYANPFNPLVCPLIALGIWFTLDASRLSSTSNLFADQNVKPNAPAKNIHLGCHRYSEIILRR